MQAIFVTCIFEQVTFMRKFDRCNDERSGNLNIIELITEKFYARTREP